MNLLRVSGFGVSSDGGELSMNPRGDGLVMGNNAGPAKLVANNGVFNGFSVHSSAARPFRSEEQSELQSPDHLVCRLLLEKKKNRLSPPSALSSLPPWHPTYP